jgi:cytochrome d ubiquinol oxidase subunit I
MLTKNAVSPSVSTATVAISLAVFVLLYVVLAVVDLLLMLKYAREQLPPVRGETEPSTSVPVSQY